MLRLLFGACATALEHLAEGSRKVLELNVDAVAVANFFILHRGATASVKANLLRGKVKVQVDLGSDLDPKVGEFTMLLLKWHKTYLLEDIHDHFLLVHHIALLFVDHPDGAGQSSTIRRAIAVALGGVEFLQLLEVLVLDEQAASFLEGSWLSHNE